MATRIFLTGVVFLAAFITAGVAADFGELDGLMPKVIVCIIASAIVTVGGLVMMIWTL